MEATRTQGDSIADLEDLGATSEGKVMLAMEPDPIAQQVGTILDGLVNSLREGSLCLFTTAGAAKGVGLVLDDFDLGQGYFKDLPLGGGCYTCSLQTGLTMGTRLRVVVMSLIWICALLQGGAFMPLLPALRPTCFLPLAHGHQGRFFESIAGRGLGGVAAVFVCQLKQNRHDGIFAFLVEVSCLLLGHVCGWYPTSGQQKKPCQNSY